MSLAELNMFMIFHILQLSNPYSLTQHKQHTGSQKYTWSEINQCIMEWLYRVSKGLFLLILLAFNSVMDFQLDLCLSFSGWIQTT